MTAPTGLRFRALARDAISAASLQVCPPAEAGMGGNSAPSTPIPALVPVALSAALPAGINALAASRTTVIGLDGEPVAGQTTPRGLVVPAAVIFEAQVKPGGRNRRAPRCRRRCRRSPPREP